MTDIEICNLALGHIGAETITAFTDSTQEARKCNLFYVPARDWLLRSFEWSFATRHVDLAVLSGVTPTRYTYAYQYPSDCLHFRSIYLIDHTLEKHPYMIVANTALDGKEIWTDVEDAKGVYTAKVTVANLFDSQFVFALSYFLASQLAVPIAKSTKLAKDMLAVYTSMVASAQASDANEYYDDQEVSDSILNARN